MAFFRECPSRRIKMALPVADSSFGIKKSVIHAGKADFPEYTDGTKVTFNYQTRKCNEECTVIDDSKKNGKPMELIIGKKFKFEVWEQCLKTMKVGETASFKVDQSLTGLYPVVARSLRDIFRGKAPPSHSCCGMAMADQGLGYSDLDELLKDPQPLEFILDVLSVEEPGHYKKETWAMDADEKLSAVPKLKEEGNLLYRAKKHSEAAEKYGEALGMLEQLLLREKPGDEEWVKLDHHKIPLLLNFSQCKLLEKDFYPVIEHTTEVLKKDPDNVKALFRRAKAHTGVWNFAEARQDYEQAVKLDPSLTNSINKELQIIDDLEKQKNKEDQDKYQGKMFG